MRTTVEMKPEHRSALLALAAQRGQKGFSSVLGEAIDLYLAGEQDRCRQREKFLSFEGFLSDEEGEELARNVARIRSHWR
jgi:hypothetical protein